MSEFSNATSKRPRRLPPVGPRLKVLLAAVLGLFAVEAINAVYLVAVRVAGWLADQSYENRLYLMVFLCHLILGLAIIVPAIVFGLAHMGRARHSPNRRAVRVGYGLLGTALVLIASGIVLTRIEGVIVVKNLAIREVAYWLHVASPLVAAWLFVLHRLAGPRIRWRAGVRWAKYAFFVTAILLGLQLQGPNRWQVGGDPEGEQHFAPSLARTASGEFISAQVLDNNGYCKECHGDVHARWSSSAHRLSSFNNPPYSFSVRRTRDAALGRDGDVRAARFCAGCHDPVPFFSGRFDDPNFDDVSDPTARAGITCTVCHAISSIDSPRGNADFTIDIPVHYPFTFSGSDALRWVNRQLVKAKPELHKRTFLKPLHKTPEFCGACHKVHLPETLNNYKWLRGQNHYDSFLLSGVSGHGVASFYYPDKAEKNCSGCHMPLKPSNDFGARPNDESGRATVHDHLFPSANTAVAVLANAPAVSEVIEAHQDFLQDIVRLDIFGLRENGALDGRLLAPLGPESPALEPGRDYLIEIVIRTTGLGHLLTEGTADSNQLWLEVEARSGGRLLGMSGAVDELGMVDPWSHFVNAYVLDRDGNRIDRRNAEDIFIPLYNNQIPPGAADVVHYRIRIPNDIEQSLELDVALKYRKFDTTFMRHVFGEDYVNDLPVTVLDADRLVLGLADSKATVNPATEIPEWQRWNDYGIGLLRKKGRGQLRQAEEAFARVEALGRGEGALNLARVYLREGRLAEDAPAALARAAELDPPAPPWSMLWFSGQVKRQNGQLDEAIRDFEQIIEGGFAEARGRGFDFSMDYRLLDELAGTLYQRALRERGKKRREQREALLLKASDWYRRALEIDPENLAAHWGLKQILADLGDAEGAAFHAGEHARYRPDNNARDRATTAARRRDPAADHAAEAIVIYDLQRPGAFGLDHE